MDLRRAIDSTISYAAYFHFPLYPEELHRWLICHKPVSIEELQSYSIIKMTPANRRFRTQTDFYSKQKIAHAQKMVSLIRFVPGLRLIALTGSVAANSTKKDDDIDLLFVTRPHTLWLVRPIIIGLITVFFRRRWPQEDHRHAPNAFCPNLWLDTLSLTIPTSKRSLYTAHEVLQIFPLLDREGTYQSFLQANSWTKKYLANAYISLTNPNNRHSAPGPGIHPHTTPIYYLSSVFCNLLLAPFNLIFFLFQFIYMSPKKTSETVNLHSAFLHTTDFSTKLDTHLNGLNNI